MARLDWRTWRHITKLDPDKPISQAVLQKVLNSGTDAIMISGTQGITASKIKYLLELIGDHPIPKVLEPNSPQLAQLDGFDYIFVPCVLNSLDREYIIGKHLEWVVNHRIDWDKIVPEAYIVLNPDSAVAQLTNAQTQLSLNQILGYAILAERYFKFPVVYLEYSGSYGDPGVVSAVSQNLRAARLFYGGGIDSSQRAIQMLSYADTILVGNVLYTKGIQAYLQTIP